MSSAEAEASTSSTSLSGVMARLRASPRLALIIGVAAAVAILAALLFWAHSPNYAVLYSGLASRDGGDVIARLDQLHVPYHLSGGGSTIKVPRSQVDHVRLELASDGLPKGGGIGFEVMNNEPFGISEFAEKVNYRRALSGELARSIGTIDGVASARVQLAIPKSSVFVRERKKPKASVVLELYAGRALSGGQINAIQHLVASAVPGLPADAVTVVDGHGHLLSSDNAPTGANTSRLSYVQRVEHAYQQRIQNLLTPLVGSGNVRAQVVADIDFSSRERTRENYTPNSGDRPAAIRSEETGDKVDNTSAEGGVPGALSNQPSPDQPSPINDAKQQNAQNAQNGDTQNEDTSEDSDTKDASRASTSHSATTNYELDHVIEHITEPVGRLRHLSVAVVINQPDAPDTDGAPVQGKDDPAGLSSDRMDQIRNLVRNAVGYSADRGDSIKVLQIPFDPDARTQTARAPAWWQNATLQSAAIQAGKYLLIALIAWLLWAHLVRPLLDRAGLSGARTAKAPAAGATPPPREEAETEEVAQKLRAQRRQRSQEILRNAQETARDDPRMVAMIVKNWMEEDA